MFSFPRGGDRSCAKDVFFKETHVCRSGCVYAFLSIFFFLNPGCGYSRLAPSVLQVAKTTSNNKRGEAERALRSRGVRAFKSSDRGGELGASLPAFARPRVCFKLLQALQPSLSERVSVRHLERGEGEGGLLLPFVCVWEEEWHAVWLSVQLFQPVASPYLNWGCLFTIRAEVLLLLVSPKEVSPGSDYRASAVWAGCDWEEGGRQRALCPLVFLLYRKKKAEEPVLLLWVNCGYGLLSRRECFEGKSSFKLSQLNPVPKWVWGSFPSLPHTSSRWSWRFGVKLVCDNRKNYCTCRAVLKPNRKTGGEFFFSVVSCGYHSTLRYWATVGKRDWVLPQ